MARAISESQYLISISGFPSDIYFQGKTGGEKMSTTGTYNDGLKRTNISVKGSQSVSDVVLERGYDPLVDQAFMTFLDSYCPRINGDLIITIQPIESCTDSNPIGKPFVYSGCQPLGYTPPDINRAGDAVSMIRYTFAVDNLTIG